MVNSDLITQPKEAPNSVRLDASDVVILRELVKDARIPNNVLAAKAGVAPSTCLSRVRALRDAGVIKGFHAEVDLEALGLGVYALISVRIHSHARARMLDIARELSGLPNVLSLFLLGGDRDFLVHVASESPAALRDFIAANLGANSNIASIQTNLVFGHFSSAG